MAAEYPFQSGGSTTSDTMSALPPIPEPATNPLISPVGQAVRQEAPPIPDYAPGGDQFEGPLSPAEHTAATLAKGYGIPYDLASIYTQGPTKIPAPEILHPGLKQILKETLISKVPILNIAYGIAKQNERKMALSDWQQQQDAATQQYKNTEALVKPMLEDRFKMDAKIQGIQRYADELMRRGYPRDVALDWGARIYGVTVPPERPLKSEVVSIIPRGVNGVKWTGPPIQAMKTTNGSDGSVKYTYMDTAGRSQTTDLLGIESELPHTAAGPVHGELKQGEGGMPGVFHPDTGKMTSLGTGGDISSTWKFPEHDPKEAENVYLRQLAVRAASGDPQAIAEQKAIADQYQQIHPPQPQLFLGAGGLLSVPKAGGPATPVPMLGGGQVQGPEKKLTPEQVVKHQQENGQLGHTLDLLESVYKNSHLLDNAMQAGKLKFASGPQGIVKGAVSRNVKLSPQETQLIGDMNELSEAINVMRVAMGGQGFRGQEAWNALQGLHGDFMANPNITRNVLKRTTQAVLAQYSARQVALLKNAGQQPVLDAKTAKLYLMATGGNKVDAQDLAQRHGWTMP